MDTRDLYRPVGYCLMSPGILSAIDNGKNEIDICNRDKGSEPVSVAQIKFDYREIASRWKQEFLSFLIKTIEYDNNKLSLPDESHIRLHLMSLSYGKETKHPISAVYFFNPKTPNEVRDIFCIAIDFDFDSCFFLL